MDPNYIGFNEPNFKERSFGRGGRGGRGFGGRGGGHYHGDNEDREPPPHPYKLLPRYSTNQFFKIYREVKKCCFFLTEVAIVKILALFSK